MSEPKNGLRIHSENGKTDIYLDGNPIGNRCLSCEIKVDGPHQPVATIVILCDAVDVDMDDGIEVTKVTPSELQSY